MFYKPGLLHFIPPASRSSELRQPVCRNSKRIPPSATLDRTSVCRCNRARNGHRVSTASRTSKRSLIPPPLLSVIQPATEHTIAPTRSLQLTPCARLIFPALLPASAVPKALHRKQIPPGPRLPPSSPPLQRPQFPIPTRRAKLTTHLAPKTHWRSEPNPQEVEPIFPKHAGKVHRVPLTKQSASRRIATAVLTTGDIPASHSPHPRSSP